ELDRGAVPDSGVGPTGAPRARPRRRTGAPVGADRPRLPTRRTRPGGRLGPAHGNAAVGGRAPNRAALRRDPLPRAGDRSAGGTAAGLALAGGAVRDARRD